MEQSNTNITDSPAEKVDGGCLPDWEVADLPAPPPYRFSRAFRTVLGPGIIALGGSIGSGEWLLGPAITAQYGGRLLWIATIAILLQSFINTESIRYTIYTGEPMFSGYMRCKPGSRFWAFFYSIIDFFGIWPGWAATAATAIAAAWLGIYAGGSLTKAQCDSLRIWRSSYVWGSSSLARRYTTPSKRSNWRWLIWIIGYLLLIDLFMVPPKVWWTVIKGFFSFGALPSAEER